MRMLKPHFEESWIKAFAYKNTASHFNYSVQTAGLARAN
jgi:hypothetical protein